MLRNKRRWRKGEMARTIVLYCLRVLTLVLIWAVAAKTYAIIKWGSTVVSYVLVYAGGSFGLEMISVEFNLIFAKKQDVEEEN